MAWNSICPKCGANIYRRLGGRTKRNFLSGKEMFVCDSCGWRGTIKGGRTVMESLGRPPTGYPPTGFPYSLPYMLG